MRDLLQQYLTYLEVVRHSSPHTVLACRRDVTSFLDHLETRSGKQLKAGAVEMRWIRRYLGQRIEAGASARSVARQLSSIKGFFRYLVETGELESSPAESVEGPRLGRPLPNTPTRQTLEKALQTPHLEDDETWPRDRALLELLYGSGLRIGEALGLEVQQVDLSSGWVRVMGKGRKERAVPIGQHASEALRAWLELRGSWANEKSGQALFLGKRGGPLNPRSAYEIVRVRLSHAGGKVASHPHALRHAYATHMLDSGADLRVIQDLLGHASLSTTQIYAHVSSEKMKREHRLRHPRADRSRGGGQEEKSTRQEEQRREEDSATE